MGITVVGSHPSVDPEEEYYCVWPENEKVLDAFLKCSTQWKVAGMGGVLGLDYQGVAFALKSYDITLTADEFADFQAMEYAAVKVINRKPS